MNTILSILLIVHGFTYQIVQGEYITLYPGYITEYQERWLVAHAQNVPEWSEIEVGERIFYRGDWYRVENIYRFKAIEPTNEAGNLIYLPTGQEMTPQKVLGMVRCDGCVTLQTCIDTDVPAWGRLFIKARRYDVSRVRR